MGHYGSENFKTLLFPQLWIIFNQTFLEKNPYDIPYKSCL